MTSQIGLNAIYFILTIKIYDLTKSSTAVSILLLTFTLPSIFFGYLAGVYVDQLSLKKVMLLTNLVRSILIMFLIFLINSPLLLLILVFLLAFATLFFVPAEGAAIPALVTEKRLIAANSLFSLTLQLSVVIGFLAGGFSLSFLGEKVTLFSIFLLFILSLLLNLFLPEEIRADIEERRGGMLANFVKGVVFVFSKKIIRDSIFFLTMSATIILILATIGPSYVDKVLQTKVTNASLLIIAPATLGMAIGAVAIGTIGHRLKERTMVNFGLLGMGLTFLLITYLSSASFGSTYHILSLALIFFLGFENALITIPVTTDFQRNTPEELRGRAYGVLSTFVSGVATLPVLISGALSDTFGVRTVLLTLGVVVLAFGIYRLRRRTV